MIIAELDQGYRLKASAAGEREAAKAPRLEPRAVSRLDWHNARSEFLAKLNERLDAARDDTEREAVLTALAKQL